MTQGCWASIAPPCEGDLTREHIVSASLFPEGLHVRGLPWCRDTFRQIGTPNLTTKCLCQGHNNRMSVLDAQMARYKRVIQQVYTYCTGQAQFPPADATLDAHLIVRWCAKTLCNIQASQGDVLNHHVAQFAAGVVNEMPYAGTPMVLQQRLRPHDNVHVGIHHDGGTDTLARFDLFGMVWCVATIEKSALTPADWESVHLPHSATMQVDRPARITFNPSHSGPEVSVMFTWAPSGDAIS